MADVYSLIIQSVCWFVHLCSKGERFDSLSNNYSWTTTTEPNRTPSYHIRRVAKCQNYTFEGVFHYKSSSMLIHLYIGCTLVYGWMTRLILLRKGFLWHFMQKITKKACFWGFPSRKFIFRARNSKLATNVFKRMLLISEHVALA